MRLKQIKLSGFKSFVDPTAFDVPSQLVGVVGPNGCGKSNVIDAVRWVLGESKASELRGESMQDVIFSGSVDRKPASRASVELIFDNNMGRIGGSWGAYTEISVRRTLSRDNQSVYQINNQVVRRRDVHDMFLGTGLGPRAYAIIGQGTISRIIEAKPEELRVFLEEAAGVSKYKERRRETESRLSSTRENLTRVEDIDRELVARIDRLSEQAEVAATFKDLDTDRLKKQHLQWIVRRDDAKSAQSKAAAVAEGAQTALEEKVAALRSVETESEKIRQHYEQAGTEVHSLQAVFYEANVEVSRLEGEVKRVQESRQRLQTQNTRFEAELQRLNENDVRAREQSTSDGDKLVQARARLDELAREVETRQSELKAASEQLLEAGATLEAARSAEAQNQRLLDRESAAQRATVERLQSLSRRTEKARAEAAALSDVDADDLTRCLGLVTRLGDDELTLQSNLNRAQEAWEADEKARMPAQQNLREVEAKFSQIDARLSALRDLQNRLDRQNDMHNWLEQRGMGELKPVWQRVRIDDDWEAAVETVLRERVSAIEIDQLENALSLADDAPPAKLVLFSGEMLVGKRAADASGLKPLISVVRSGEAAVQQRMGEWLSGYYAAESLAQAFAMREQLPEGGSFVVRAGHRLSRTAVQLFAADSEHEGVLQRQHELENLDREQRAQGLIVNQARSDAEAIEASAAEHQKLLGETRQKHANLNRELANARIVAQRTEQQAERVSQDRTRIQAQIAECEAEATELAKTDTGLQSLTAELAQTAQSLLNSRSQARERQREADSLVSVLREKHRSTEIQAQTAQFEVRALDESVQRLKHQIEDAGTRIETLTAELTESQHQLAGLTTEQLDAQLLDGVTTRQQRETSLADGRTRQDDLANTLRESQERRMTIEREREPLVQKTTEMQLKEQASRLAVVQYQDQLNEAEVDEEAETALRTGFEPIPKASWLQAEVTKIAKLIDALGPVNLAALGELEEASERKSFLDSQSADLNEAITTLEEAIKQIDLETRQMLQATFDTVNSQFGTLFPELFGGGEARLVLTGDEILDAGVQVMAHPPGKRNSSVHLLSGGEKALTAIALVFALFHLNPAPFCLLDEVDAPLDDANTERYRDMVTRMSQKTQFLFITHNKIAMEMAQQLIGVTMQERGVSRIVAVDLDVAGGFAEAA